MRKLAVVITFVTLLYVGTPSYAAKRFGRTVISLESPKDYQYFKLDDVEFPMLAGKDYSVSCLVYRGTERYYLEISIQNKASNPVILGSDFVEFTKPGYTVFRQDTGAAAARLASDAGQRFIPTPPPQMPANSTTTTTLHADATTYGNMTNINGTATSTTTDTSGQAGANFGNAIGNAIASRRFYNAQRDEMKLVQYLDAFGWRDSAVVLQPGKVQTVMLTYEQAKQKKAPFQITIHVGTESFAFKYKE